MRSQAESAWLDLKNDFVTTLIAARELAADFQDNFRIRRASSCYPDLLAGLEALVLEEDSHIDQVRLGLYWSQVAFKHSFFFGASTSPLERSSMVSDSWGALVPEPIAKAEKLLLSASCGNMEPGEAKTVALRF